MSLPKKGREMTASEWGALNPCQRLEIVEFALVKLLAGEKRIEVRHGDYWVRYHDSSVPALERERNRLSALCNKRHAISIGRRCR